MTVQKRFLTVMLTKQNCSRVLKSTVTTFQVHVRTMADQDATILFANRKAAYVAAGGASGGAWMKSERQAFYDDLQVLMSQKCLSLKLSSMK